MPWTRTYRNRDEFERAFPQKEGVRGLAYRDAILESTVELMEEDKRVFVIGQGVDDAGGYSAPQRGSMRGSAGPGAWTPRSPRTA